MEQDINDLANLHWKQTDH